MYDASGVRLHAGRQAEVGSFVEYQTLTCMMNMSEGFRILMKFVEQT